MKLNDEQLKENLAGVPGWELIEDKISKEFELKDFKSALDFVNRVGEEAEAMDHHPDILMHSWNMVRISFNTHTEGGVTEKDFKLAGKIEGVAR